MRARGSLPGLALLIASGSGCGSSAVDPTVLPPAHWGEEVAAVECQKIFGCCDATERMAFPYTDEAQCRQMIAEREQTGIGYALSTGLVSYDGKAAHRCIDEMTAFDCMHLPLSDPGALLGPSCSKVLPGRGGAGAACEDLDVVCKSSDCNPTTGTCSAPDDCWNVTCDAGQYCEPTLPGCTPVKADGATCFGSSECTPPSVCMFATHVCTPPLPDGTACTWRGDCASGICAYGTGTSQLCQPRVCDGV